MSCHDCNSVTIPASTIPGPAGDDGADGANGLSVASGSVSAGGTLTLTLSDGSQVVVSGSLLGPQGPAGNAAVYTVTKSLLNPGTFTVTQSELTGAGLTMATFYGFTYDVFQSLVYTEKGAGNSVINPAEDARLRGTLTSVGVNNSTGDITFTVSEGGNYTITFVG